jgi:hypothetical protein
MIQEEVEIHKCFKELTNALFDTDGTFSFDGKKWYNICFPEWTAKSSPTRIQQHYKHEDDSTEPKFIII